jgi:hypothetical protein
MVSTVYTGDHSGVADPGSTAKNDGPKRLTSQQQGDLIAWAQAWFDAGCAVHPAKADGSKMPVSVRHGSPDIQADTFPATYQFGRLRGMPHPQAGQANPEAGQHGYGWGRIATGDLPRLTPQQIAAHIRSGRVDGIGVFGGLASGGLEMVEIEGRARDLLTKVREAAERLGHLSLLERLAAGCVEESPSEGLHFVLRVTDGEVLGNTPLARRPDPAADGGVQVLAETRGQGGWFVCAPSAGRTHKSGKPYRMVRGGPETIPTFTAAERDALYECFRAIDEMPPEPERPAHQGGAASAARRERPAGDILPGDDFNGRASWDEILLPAGWTRGQVAGDRQHWIRPGKTHGSSATTTDGVLCCFSLSAGLPVFAGRGSKNALSKFATYAHLNHGGDFAAAARALWELGYGSRGDDQGDQAAQVPVEPRPAPAGPARTLTDWRQEVGQRRVEAVLQRGVVSLDHSPTGSGKSFATNTALRHVSSSLTVLPTHANVREHVQEMQQEPHGLTIVPYPELSPENCQQFDVARRAQSLGLVAGAAVCPGCEFRDGCEYRAQAAAAESAPRRACTAERFRRSSQVTVGVDVVVIDEMPEAALAPTLTISTKQLTAVETLAHAIRNHWYSQATHDQKSFAAALLDVVASIHATCADITTAGTRPVALSVPHTVPKQWQRLLFDSIRQVGVDGSLDADALTLVTKAAAGELGSLQIVTDQTKRGQLHHYVVGSWRPSLPASAAIVCTDATGNADDLAAVIGRPVVDCTPTGSLPLCHPVVQIPDDISRGTSSATVAGYVESFVAANPGLRLGLIGHSRHIRDLIDGGLLSESTRNQVAKWCYFGQGPDRGSNGWHEECDHLLRLGTPRANPGDYRRWLVQHDLHAAAGRLDGDWGRRDWEAVTVDGQPVTVQGSGYRDSDWHRAYTAISRAAGQQADGRGRSIMPDGIPTTIFSNEPGPYPIAPSLVTTPAVDRETVEIVRQLGQPGKQPPVWESAVSPIGDSYRVYCALGWHQTQQVESAVMQQGTKRAGGNHGGGVTRRAAQTRLKHCLDAGLLANPRHGWWCLPEFAAAQSDTQQQPPVDAVTAERPAPLPEAPALAVVGPAAALVPRPIQAVVIAATGPAAEPAVDVVAATTQATTTLVCTATAAPPSPHAVDDWMLEIDERAAIMEFDGGLDRETADRLALEMKLGRNAAPQPTGPSDVVVASDPNDLHARSQPYVQQLLNQIPGTVRVIDDRHDPFAGRSRPPSRPGWCRCGHCDWVQVPIHGGASIRSDCRHCDRFGWFAVWYGKPMPAPGKADDDDLHQLPASVTPRRRDQLLLPPAPAAHGVDPPAVFSGWATS